MMMKQRINKHAQHEIAGFVLIVLLVSVIGVVFLSVTLGKPDVNRQSSIEVSNLLAASMLSTTDCAVGSVLQLRDIQGLIKECYEDQTGNSRNCIDGRDVCQVLENSLEDIIDKSLVAGEGSVNKAYKLDIYFSDNESPNEEIVLIENGVFANCTSVVGGNHPVSVGSFGFGKIDTELLVCKS